MQLRGKKQIMEEIKHERSKNKIQKDRRYTEVMRMKENKGEGRNYNKRNKERTEDKMQTNT